MVSRFYQNWKKINAVEELTGAILDVWENLDDVYIRGLYDSIPRRLISVFGEKRILD